MKRTAGRWPFLVVGIGGILIGVFFVLQNRSGELAEGMPTSDTQTGVVFTAVPTTVSPTVTPTLRPTPTVTPLATATAVPLVPTLTYTATPEPSTDPQPTATAVFLTKTPGPDVAVCSADSCIPRFGVSGKIGVIAAAHLAGLPFGHYLDWELESRPVEVGEAQYWQMVRVSETGIRHEWAELAEAVEMNPGGIWIVGNEPDIEWQDNTTPERFAVVYHDVYQFIKVRDPSAFIAMGGVGQPTPLRLAYLDIVLESYANMFGEMMPVDIWTIHNFILREERDSWGVGIPPGMVGPSGEGIDEGILYEIPDHNDLGIFEQNLIDFRVWMAERGYRERPLAVTEFGILMPSDFGFPPEVVAEFLVGSFGFLATATDETIGYPADDHHLVQWAFWYSVYDDDEFPTGNLYDPETAVLTPLGELYANFIEGN